MAQRIVPCVILVLISMFAAFAVRYPWLRPRWRAGKGEGWTARISTRSCIIGAISFALLAALMAVQGWIVSDGVFRAAAGFLCAVNAASCAADYSRDGKWMPPV